MKMKTLALPTGLLAAFVLSAFPLHVQETESKPE